MPDDGFHAKVWFPCGEFRVKKVGALRLRWGCWHLPDDAGCAGDGYGAAAGDYRTNPKFLAAVKEAKEMEREKHAGLAVDAYRKANWIAGGRCVECVAGVYKMQMMDGSYKDAVGTAAEMEAMGATALVKSVAAYDRGRALVAKGGEKPKPEQMEDGARGVPGGSGSLSAEHGGGVQYGPGAGSAGTDGRGQEGFEVCLSNLKPGDAAYLRVKHFADDPELATHKMAPAFEVTVAEWSEVQSGCDGWAGGADRLLGDVVRALQ